MHLGQGWMQYFDDDTGRSYYHNYCTHAAGQWARPNTHTMKLTIFITLTVLACATSATSASATRPADRPAAVCGWWCPTGYKKVYEHFFYKTSNGWLDCKWGRDGPGHCADTRLYQGEGCVSEPGVVPAARCAGRLTCGRFGPRQLDSGLFEATCELPTNPEACTADIGSCSWYKTCLAPAHQCDGTKDEYAVSYGYKYCSGFFENLHHFTELGQRWVKATCHCLTSALVPTLDHPASGEAQCTDLRKFAFDSHPACYTGPDKKAPELTICNMLHTTDLPLILKITASGFFNRAGVAQIISTAKTCASQLTGRALDRFETLTLKAKPKPLALVEEAAQDGATPTPEPLEQEDVEELLAKAALALEVSPRRLQLMSMGEDGDLDVMITTPAAAAVVVAGNNDQEEEKEGEQRVRSSIELKTELSRLLTSGALDGATDKVEQVRETEELMQQAAQVTSSSSAAAPSLLVATVAAVAVAAVL